MTKLKRWLWNKFLPDYCREGLLDENKRLTRQISALRAENDRLSSYIDGMETAMRLGRRVTVNTGEVRQ